MGDDALVGFVNFLVDERPLAGAIGQVEQQTLLSGGNMTGDAVVLQDLDPAQQRLLGSEQCGDDLASCSACVDKER